jgi:hypothetical protein
LKGNKILPPIYDAHGTPLTAQVDLIVPFHGQYDHVSNLIQTLWDGLAVKEAALEMLGKWEHRVERLATWKLGD